MAKTTPSRWNQRRVERGLFGAALLALALGYLAVLLVRLAFAPQFDFRDVLPLLVYAGSLGVVHVLLVTSGFRGDQILPSAALFLAGLGLLIQFRMGTLDLTDTARWSTYAFPAGLATMLLITLAFRGGRIRHLEQWAPFCALGATAVLAATLLLGHRFRGAMFLYGGINPTEVIKVLLALFLAGFLSGCREDLARSLVPPTRVLVSLAIFWGLPMVLLILQRDLGMVALLNFVFLLLLVVATGRWSLLLAGVLLAAVAGYALLHWMPHGSGRVEVWLDPFRDPTGRGWQILQSLSALYSGGLWGVGLGAGHPHVIPIAASDFIYAALGEEIGYVGCGLILAVYLILFYRGFRVADSQRDPFSQYLAAGLTALLAVQTLMNIGGVTKALPLTGITLPFVSLGGSSLVTSFAVLGLLLALSDGPPAPAGKPRGGGAGARRGKA